MKLVVAGTGYVGLVAGVCFAEKGHDVTCVDVDENKVKLMESGVSPIYEDGLEELMKRNNAAGRLHYTTDYKSAYKDPDAIFIGVGTPEQPDGSANLSYIATVCRQIAENVEKDCGLCPGSSHGPHAPDRLRRRWWFYRRWQRKQ